MTMRREKIRSALRDIKAKDGAATTNDVCHMVGYNDVSEFESLRKEVFLVTETEFPEMIGENIFLDEGAGRRVRKLWENVERRPSAKKAPVRNMLAVQQLDPKYMRYLDAEATSIVERAARQKLPSQRAVETVGAAINTALREVGHANEMRKVFEEKARECAAIAAREVDRERERAERAENLVQNLIQAFGRGGDTEMKVPELPRGDDAARSISTAAEQT